MKFRHTLAALAIAPIFLVPAAAYAQSAPAQSAPVQSAPAQIVPDVAVQEMLIKQTILTLNDANLTNNYTVFYARSSTALQQVTSPEKMAEVFKHFRDIKARMGGAAISPVSSKTAEMLPNGLLHLVGELTILNYNLTYIVEDGSWALIDISIGPPSKK